MVHCLGEAVEREDERVWVMRCVGWGKVEEVLAVASTILAVEIEDVRVTGGRGGRKATAGAACFA